MSRAGALATVLIALLASSVDAANRYDPRLRFRTLTTTHFAIHYHQGEEPQARRLASIVEEVSAQLEPQFGRPRGRVHVILVDQTDLPNGWATPIPYNLIELTAVPPTGESIIGNTNDWLRLVFTHEYTHVLHLDRSRSWASGLRAVFGRSPLVFPNLFLPLWQIEGIATFEESALTGSGRVPAGDFRAILDVAAARGSLEPLDRVNGGLVDWPSGHAQYAYGAYFHEYLADRYGPDSVRRLADQTAGRLPYFGSRAFRKVFGRSLGDLWRDFEAERERRVPQDAARVPVERLTHHGFLVEGPRYGPDGRIYYSVANPHDFPALMSMAGPDGQARHVADRFLGARVSVGREMVVFDQLEVTRNVGLQSDLYSTTPEGAANRRLTRGARAADPDVSPDGRTIVCVVQQVDRRLLATMSADLATAGGSVPQPLVSEPSTEFAAPRWSPDGRAIAVERRRIGGPSEIVLVDAASRAVRTLVASTAARNVTPVWTADGKYVLFASDRGDAPFNIFAADAETGAILRVTDVPSGAESPELSPDGEWLVFVGYSVDGYDLFRTRADRAAWVPAGSGLDTVEEAPAPAKSQGPATSVTDADYSPLATLAPRYWLPLIESNDGELSVGAETSGFDALGRHAYGATLTFTLERARPDWQLAYAYDRWRPTLFVSVADDTDPFRDAEVRTREVNGGALLPIRRVRWAQTILMAFNASRDTVSCETGCEEGIVPSTATRRSLRFGWTYDSAKTYGYSVSAERGIRLGVTGELTREALGSGDNVGAVTADARIYRRAWPRHGAVAARIAGATSWGDGAARRVFSASGAGPQDLDLDFDVNAIGLLRGFPSDAVVGRHAALANFDYRFPLGYVERGVGTVPFFLRSAHAAVFADAGHAWSRDFVRSRSRLSVGAELSLDIVVGYWLPLTFTTGAAWRHDGDRDRRDIVAFGRIGRAF